MIERRSRSVGALVTAAGWFGPGAAAHCAPLARLLDIPLRVSGDAIVLTFDDGPHPEGTPATLAALAQRGARATFFLVGEQVSRHPALAAEIVAAGHEVGVHGYRHRNQMRLSPRALARDTTRAVDVIGTVCGSAPRRYRPPYGAFTAPGLLLTRRLGLEPLLWSRWGRDWRAKTTAAQIAVLAAGGIEAGDVVLLHDADWYCAPGAFRRTVKALPEILASVASAGLRAISAEEASSAPAG